jgi:hypothetical protein
MDTEGCFGEIARRLLLFKHFPRADLLFIHAQRKTLKENSREFLLGQARPPWAES